MYNYSYGDAQRGSITEENADEFVLNIRKEMIPVVDTNVLVSALVTKSKGSKSYLLVKDLLEGKHKMCISTDIMGEYEDVLNYLTH